MVDDDLHYKMKEKGKKKSPMGQLLSFITVYSTHTLQISI